MGIYSIIGVVLASLFALSVALMGSGELPQWLLRPSVTDWIQAVSTASAAGLAWKAYRNWWQQEIGRAKAEQARELIPKVNDWSYTVRRARRPHINAPKLITQYFLQQVFTPERAGKMRDSEQASKVLSDVIALAIDDRVRLLLGKCVRITLQIVMAHDDATVFTTAEPEQMEAHEAELREWLRLMGMPPYGTKPGEDEISNEIEHCASEIERILRNHIKYVA